MKDNVGRLCEMVRGLCPRDLDALGGGREAGAPWVTRVRLVRPNVCVQPGPAVTRTRGVGDAAPYGCQRDVDIRIVVNKCARPQTASHPSAPLKGELSRREAP